MSPKEVLHLGGHAPLPGGDAGIGGGAGGVDHVQARGDAVQLADIAAFQRGLRRLRGGQLLLQQRQALGVIAPALDGEEGEGQQSREDQPANADSNQSGVGHA